jgi:hypothetical protein
MWARLTAVIIDNDNDDNYGTEALLSISLRAGSDFFRGHSVIHVRPKTTTRNRFGVTRVCTGHNRGF